MAGLSKAERRRHDQKVTLPSSLFLPLGRGMNNTPQEEGCSNSDSTMSVSSEPTEVRLENNSRAPAGLHTSETTPSKERTTAERSARELQRHKEMRKVLEEKARRYHRFVKDPEVRENLIESSIASGLEEERLKQLQFKIYPKALRLVREAHPFIESEMVLEPLIKTKMRELMDEETKKNQSIQDESVRETDREKHQSIQDESVRETDRDKKLLKHLKEQANKSWSWVRNLEKRKEMIETQIKADYEKEKKKQLHFKMYNKAAKEVR